MPKPAGHCTCTAKAVRVAGKQSYRLAPVAAPSVHVLLGMLALFLHPPCKLMPMGLASAHAGLRTKPPCGAWFLPVVPYPNVPIKVLIIKT
ncbi:hypothetical protein TIFTF001_024413 [Ficus carica]|uniref:Uncharacterized protein n=1 Tax=Ficus carica TaxID=3494 RepID=A0AA88AM17_FICCA|nr:hypothetical protein TIFTF001_024413 [Ficus carica]